jgi:hypothetical protein
MKVVQFEATPNPNAVKCLLDGTASDGPRSYFNAAAAEADPLARALFALPGVTNVLILGGFITVSKHPEAAWSTLKPAVRRVIEGHA